MIKWLLLALFLSSQAYGQVELPWTFAPNTPIQSSQVNANFSATANELNAFENLVACENVGYGVDTGTANNYIVSIAGSPFLLTPGLLVTFEVLNTNTGASTLNLNGLGSKNITLPGMGALPANYLLAGSIAIVEYDGTEFQLISQSTQVVTVGSLSAVYPVTFASPGTFGLAPAAAGYFYAGPVSGPSALPSPRPIFLSDLPSQVQTVSSATVSAGTILAGPSPSPGVSPAPATFKAITQFVPPINLAHYLGTLSWPKTVSCAWTSTATSFSNFSAVSACPSPTVTSPSSEIVAPSTKIPAFSIASLPPGVLHIEATGEFQASPTGPGCVWRFSDGTNVSGNGWNYNNTSGSVPGFPQFIGNIYYSSGISSTTTVQIQVMCFSSANAAILDDDQTTAFTIDVSYQPIQGLL
jgi:hypothetical protein